MTEPKAPSFNGVPIRVGDMVTLPPLRVREISLVEPGMFWVTVGQKPVVENIRLYPTDLASHTPAPRPLVPGPAVLDRVGATQVEVLAVDGAEAWVRFSNGSRHTLDASRLRNTEGAPS